MTWLVEHPRRSALSVLLILVVALGLLGIGSAVTDTSTAGGVSLSHKRVTQQLRKARASAAKDRTMRVRSESSLRLMTDRARRWKARAQGVEARLDAAKTRARKRHRSGGRG